MCHSEPAGEESHNQRTNTMPKIKTENIIIFVLAVAVAALCYLHFAGGALSSAKVLSSQEAGEAALAFINEYMLEPGTEAELKGDVSLERGLYKFTVQVGEQEVSSYITQDGTMLFPQEGIDLEEVKAELAASEETVPTALKTCDDLNIEKRQAPVLEGFVVSYCPFGLQMQRILNEIVKEIPELSDNIKIRYMGQVESGKVMSMHGEEEAQENLRQICLREEQGPKFYAFLECFMREGKTEECLVSTGVDKAALQSCMTTPSKGVKYAQEDFDLQNSYEVTGSPSLFLNGVKVSEFDFGGRTAEAVKSLLCCGFALEKGACSKRLSAEQATASFSETYSGEGGSGNCD